MRHLCNIDTHLRRWIVHLRIFAMILDHLEASFSVSVEIFVKYSQLFQEEPTVKSYQHASNVLHSGIMFSIYPSLSICASFHYKCHLRNDCVKSNLQTIFLRLEKVVILTMRLFNGHYMELS